MGMCFCFLFSNHGSDWLLVSCPFSFGFLAKVAEISKMYILSDSGSELVREELVEVTVLREGLMGPGSLPGIAPGPGPGPAPPPPNSLRSAFVCATQADGSMGRTGSCRGIVK